MAIKDNQSKQYRIYIKESKSWVDVNKEFYTDYYYNSESDNRREPCGSQSYRAFLMPKRKEEYDAKKTKTSLLLSRMP